MGKTKMQYPQVGRWLPGYGFVFNKLVQRRGQDRKLFPHMELRDPFDVYVGWLGPDQQPVDYATIRQVPLEQLVTLFDDPADAARVVRRLKDTNTERWSFLQGGDRGWEGIKDGVEVVEYEDHKGRSIVIPEAEFLVSHTPNPIEIPTFSFSRRYTFNRPASQYNHIIGIVAMQAKLNVLYLIALEDGVMVETNIDGEVVGTYEFGRDAVNELLPGTKVTRPYPPNQNQTLQGLNQLERQLRIGAQYDVQQDGVSPNSFATGMGMRELQGAVNDNVREYHGVMANHAEVNDEIRLRWAAELYAGESRTYFDMRGKRQTANIDTTIDGDYRTRRIYGAMATFDDHQKIIVGMQLETGGYIDTLTFQENIDGLDDLELINERIAHKRARETLYELLRQESLENPAAKQALVEVMANPGDEVEILEKYFGAPDPAEAAAMEQAMMAQQQAAMGGGPVGVPTGGAPEPIQSVLSRIEGSGAVDGGVQSVAVR
jgi:hypothetical protein